MIEIRFNLRGEGLCGFSVKGHSGTAKRGEDIVCAGVSSLTQTALLGLLEVVKADVSYNVTKGKMEVELKKPPDVLTETVLQTMRLGLREISKQYPQAVKIVEQKATPASFAD